MSAFEVLFRELEERLSNINQMLNFKRLSLEEAEEMVAATIAGYLDRMRSVRVEEKRVG